MWPQNSATANVGRRKKYDDDEVPKDDLSKFDRYIRVDLPRQFYEQYERLLQYELDLIKRFINYTATWSRTEYFISCCNSKSIYMDMSVYIFFIGIARAETLLLGAFGDK